MAASGATATSIIVSRNVCFRARQGLSLWPTMRRKADVVLWRCDAVNRRIDLCDDPTWGKYVWNDELRHETCAPTPLVTPVSR